MHEPTAPQAPIEIRIDMRAVTLRDAVQQLEEILEHCKSRPAQRINMVSGGYRGSYSVTCTTRDVPIQQYRDELIAWHERLPSPSQS